jgi:hypothetical protein
MCLGKFIVELYERFDTDTHHLGHLTKLKQLDTVEDFIVSFEQFDFCAEGMSDAFFENDLSVVSKMIYVPMPSFFSPIFGWKLLKELRNHNMLSLLKLENPPLFLSLNQSLPLLLPLH